MSIYISYVVYFLFYPLLSHDYILEREHAGEGQQRPQPQNDGHEGAASVGIEKMYSPLQFS